MITIENKAPSKKELMSYIEAFEGFCTGEQRFSSSKFRQINQELSISAVMALGKRRYENDNNGAKLFWRGPNDEEYDLGYTNNANIMRDFPGFHAKRSIALGHDLVDHSEIIHAPKGKGTYSVVTLKDGSKGIGPDYRTALRNAVLKRHISTEFNKFSFATLWNKVLGET